MATPVNTYKVHFHLERAGKKASPDYIEYVQAAAGDFNSLQTVLSSNGKIRGGNTLVIDSVQEVGHGDTTLA